ncbi:hypothetical protein [Shewanella frigidimarina]|jgi:hypothetical protein|uniref:hypothetical protein n=1 Tax=Shewanella frigidimarina TaxID=56812 RepID=UPI003D7B8C31
MECRENDSNLAKIVIRHTLNYFSSSNVRRDEFVKGPLLTNLTESCSFESCPDSAEDFLRWQKTKCKQIERIIKGESPMPADFVFAWIAALPSNFKVKCMNDVCGAMGTFYTPLSPIGQPSHLREMQSHLSDVSREFADVLQNAKPAMDGVYNSNDGAADMQQLSNELFELIATCFVELGSINRASGVMPSAYLSMANSQLFKSKKGE